MSIRGEINKTILLFEESIRLLHIKNSDFKKLAEATGSLASSYFIQNDYFKSIKYGKKSLEYANLIDAPNTTDIAGVYSMMGSSYAHEGFSSRALTYLNKALQIDTNTLGNQHPYTAYSYNNLGYGLRRANRYKEAIICYEKAVKIWESGNNPNIAIAYDNIGTLYGYIGDYEQAKIYHQKAINFMTKNHPLHSELAQAYFNLGNVHKFQEDYEQAIILFNQSIQLEKRNIRKLRALLALASTNFSIGNFKKTEYYIDSLLKIVEYEKTPFFYLPSQAVVIDALILKINNNIQINKINHSKAREDTILHDLKALESIFFEQRKSLNIDAKDQIEISSRGHTIFETYLSIIFSQYASNPSKAGLQDSIFNKLQISKSLLTHLAYLNSNVVNQLKLDQEEVYKDFILRKQISELEKKIYMLREENQTKKLSDLKIELADLNIKRENNLEILKQKKPWYISQQYNLPLVSILDIQNSFEPNQALVEYFTGDTSIFIFVVTKDTFDLKEVKRNFPLSDWIKEFRDGMFAYYNPRKMPTNRVLDSLNQQYCTRAYQLYEKLLSPIKEYIPNETQLIIVPDGELGYLPFDALITEPLSNSNALRTANYLIKKHQISYAYSASLWFEMRNKQTNPTKGILAIAPSFPQKAENYYSVVKNGIRDSLYKLKYSIEEVEAVNRIWGAELLVDTFAQVHHFLDKASNYRILHLSTHGKADDRVGDYCFLAFTQKDSSDNLLYVRDLYNMHLNADMVVLSACETGLGELQRGEGILSLARGFAYAGAKSIVSTLWNVNEISTKEIIERFYSNLKKGMRKDEALRQSKLSYLKESPNYYPFHWAAFTAIGDMSPIESNNFTDNWYYILGLILLIGLLIWALRRRG